VQPPLLFDSPRLTADGLAAFATLPGLAAPGTVDSVEARLGAPAERGPHIEYLDKELSFSHKDGTVTAVRMSQASAQALAERGIDTFGLHRVMGLGRTALQRTLRASLGRFRVMHALRPVFEVQLPDKQFLMLGFTCGEEESPCDQVFIGRYAKRPLGLRTDIPERGEAVELVATPADIAKIKKPGLLAAVGSPLAKLVERFGEPDKRAEGTPIVATWDIPTSDDPVYTVEATCAPDGPCDKLVMRWAP
jgi:hypothetical protein